MTVFLDTSALYAVLDGNDANHDAAAETWERLLAESAVLVTHNYVLVEASALAQHRLGIAALRSIHEDIAPILRIEWVSQEQHRTAVEMVLAAGRKKLSVVDCASFVVMREAAISEAFCFDRHFREQGFHVLP
jgi:predicted nucleic acid-binding protein